MIHSGRLYCSISSCYLHAKRDWEPDHHPHPFRSPSADSNAFLPSKLLIPRNSIHAVCIPRFLIAIMTGDRTISYNCCVAQLFFFFIFLGVTEFYLLAAMSYDRYVAICKPHITPPS